MAKVPSPFLTGATGKFAGAAFQQSPGNGTILREVVKPTNPSTEAQVEQRAKFKLMSQVATAFKSVIAMKREGNITPRNMFVKINSPLLGYREEEKQAVIFLPELQLTKSAQAVTLTAELDAESQQATAILSADMPILYGAVFVRVSYNNNQVVIKEIGQETAEPASASITHVFENARDNDIIFAYGITQSTSGLSVKYGDYTANEGDGEGLLRVLNNLAESSSLTQTASHTL